MKIIVKQKRIYKRFFKNKKESIHMEVFMDLQFDECEPPDKYIVIRDNNLYYYIPFMTEKEIKISKEKLINLFVRIDSSIFNVRY